jgi:hypothetical protein
LYRLKRLFRVVMFRPLFFSAIFPEMVENRLALSLSITLLCYLELKCEPVDLKKLSRNVGGVCEGRKASSTLPAQTVELLRSDIKPLTN